MAGGIGPNLSLILSYLAQLERSGGNETPSTGPEIEDSTGLSANEINNAVTILYEAGLVDWLQTMGTGPFNFKTVEITPRGRFEFERSMAEPVQAETPPVISLPPSPVGSPFGFTDQDWELVAARKAERGVLTTVMGFQFESEHYETDVLLANIEQMMREAVEKYNELPGAIQMELRFHSLASGYGEHLFNEIARDIISADIAIFETSDQNPNVMIEMGVALTWGVRVLPIRAENRPKPPSDISGQTWAEYRENAGYFHDPNHMEKLVRMVERVAIKKRPA
jgi:hypothetical protein